MLLLMNYDKLGHLILGAFAGVIVAMLLFDKTAETQRLMAERNQLRRQLDELSASLPHSISYARQGNTTSQG